MNSSGCLFAPINVFRVTIVSVTSEHVVFIIMVDGQTQMYQIITKITRLIRDITWTHKERKTLFKVTWFKIDHTKPKFISLLHITFINLRWCLRDLILVTNPKSIKHLSIFFCTFTFNFNLEWLFNFRSHVSAEFCAVVACLHRFVKKVLFFWRQLPTRASHAFFHDLIHFNYLFVWCVSI